MKIVVVLALTALVALSNAENYRRVCYFANWAVYRQGIGKYTVDNLDPFECTHLMYAFTVLNNKTYEMQAHDPWIDIDNGGFAKFVALKEKNPDLKTLVALGGWNDSQFSMQYSEMVTDPNLRAKFVTQALNFVRQYGFDGLDLDWEYPGQPGLPSDKENMILLLKELRAAFSPYNLLLTMAPSCSIKQAVVSYDIPQLAQLVDFVNFMGYDIHGAWENTTDHQAPLYRRPWDEPDSPIIHESVDYWLEQGMPAEKLNLGIPAYGRSFKLADSEKTIIMSPTIGPGDKGQYTGEKGFISLYEICEYQQNGWNVVPDPTETMGPYAHNKIDWVGWDDIDTVIRKVKYAMDRKLGGVMVWELGLDDFNGICNMGERPMLTAIRKTLNGESFDTSTPRPPISPPPTPAPLSCVAEGSYFADPAECRRFHGCFKGYITTYYCPVNRAFNPNTARCDLPKNVRGCQDCCQF